jgi:hypothetical protein
MQISGIGMEIVDMILKIEGLPDLRLTCHCYGVLKYQVNLIGGK